MECHCISEIFIKKHNKGNNVPYGMDPALRRAKSHGSKMYFHEEKMKDHQKQGLRPIGRGFVINAPIPGGPAGRSLAMAYIDSNNRKYIKINGNLEPLEERHSFLPVD